MNKIQNFEIKINNSHFLTWILLILPILFEQPFIDNLPSTIFFVFLLIIMVIVELGQAKDKKIFYVDKYYFYLVLSLFIISLFIILSHREYLDLKGILTGNIYFSVCFLLVVIFYNNLNENYFFNVYRTICILAILLLVLQYFLFYVFKIIPELDINSLIILKVAKYNNRFSSIFSEPAHLVRYVFPLFLYELFNRKNIVIPTFTSIGILLSTSSMGLVLLVISWPYFILKKINFTKFKISKNLIKKVAFLLILIVILLIINLNQVDSTIKRTLEGASSSIRVFRGLDIFLNLPNYYKITGIGFLNIRNYCSFNKFTSNYIVKHDLFSEYSNTIAYFLITGGIFWFIFFILFLRKLSNILIGTNKIFFYSFLVMCFFAYMHAPSTWIFHMTILYLLADKRNMKKIVF